MDFGVKEVAILVGLIFLVGLLIDGVRRSLAARSDRIRMDRMMKSFDDVDDDEYGSELPNGGARVVSRDGGDVDQPNFDKIDTYADEQFDDYVDEPIITESRKPMPEQGALDLTDPVPMLMDPVELPERELEVQEPVAARDEFADEQLPPAEDYVVINLMAPEGRGFRVGDLVEGLKRAGMKQGAMSFYHKRDRKKNIMFSAANIVKPGSLDVEQYATITPGLSFFMTLPCADSATQVFESMLAIVSDIAEQLGGELKDEQRITMTAQVLEHCRTRIAEYERKTKLAKA